PRSTVQRPWCEGCDIRPSWHETICRADHWKVMPQILDARVSIADALSENRLLATFPDDLRQILEARMKLVDLDPGATVLNRGTDVAHALFPFGPTMISMVVDLDDGRSVEVASIGREGAVGGI